MAFAKLDLHDRSWTDDGYLNAGGLIYTYAASTDTPLATYSDSTGTANDNPIELDASGNAHIWLAVDVAYKFVFADAADVVFYTENGVLISSGGSATGSLYADPIFTYPGGPPAAGGWLGGERVTRAFSLPANMAGAFGKAPKTLPTASFAVDLRKNNVSFGTATCSTAGLWTFTTAGAAVVDFAIGDELDAYGPTPADATMADFGFTLAGALP